MLDADHSVRGHNLFGSKIGPGSYICRLFLYPLQNLSPSVFDSI